MSPYQCPAFKELERQWYEKLRESGFEDLETHPRYLKVDIHPHYQRLAFQERAHREHYVDLAQSFLWEHEFENERERNVWEHHANGVPIRKIGEILSLTRNQVWPLVKKCRQKVRVKYMKHVTVRAYRPAQGEDYEFVKASWLNSYKHSSQFAKRIRHSVFYFWHARIIDQILSRPSTEVIVATLPDTPDVILGYIVTENRNCLHYGFVKENWRKLGIGLKLFLASEIASDATFTHWTDPVDSLINNSHFKGLIYDPYRL